MRVSLLENPTDIGGEAKRTGQQVQRYPGFRYSNREFSRSLTERNRLDLLDEIVGTYEKLLDDKLASSEHELLLLLNSIPGKLAKRSCRAPSVMTGKKVRMEAFVVPR